MAGKSQGPTRLVADRRPASRSAQARTQASPPKPPKSPRKPRTPTPRRSGPLGFIGWVFRRIFGAIWGLIWRAGAVVALGLFLITWVFYAQMPDVEEMLDGRQRGSVTMLDHEGDVYAWRGETFGGQMSVADVSPNLHNAVLATEDKRFYSHFGISPRGILGAIRINLSEGRGPFQGHGGSTITQQVAKLLCLGTPYDPQKWKSEADYEADCRRGSLTRKLKEMPYAFALEWKYSKQEILSIYFNRAYLGAGTRGFEAAAQRYFGKTSRDLTPPEAAMLAGLLVAPSTYAPTNNLARSQGRANVVLGLMEEQGYLSKAEADRARANPATLSPQANQRQGGYFADWVMDTAPSYLTKDTTEDVVIHTTLDQHLQRAAEAALDHVFKTKVREGSKAQAAIVVMSADGAVRAMVGGRGTPMPGAFNRANQARRQTGSAFKPFVYAAALDQGYSPADYVDDSPLTINIPGSGPWTPQNYTRDYKGIVTLTDALRQSLNIPAVRVSEAAGRDAVRQVAEQFGIVSDLAQGPALALGVSEANLVEMTGAYAGILNGGSSVTPYGILDLRLKGETDPIIAQTGGIGERVIQEEAARYLTYMMQQVIERGTGTRARLPNREAAGKTGTTQAARDAWFLGFTADYVTGVWMGNDDNSPLTGVTGGGLPADIWKEVMVRVHDGLPARPLPKKVPEPREPPQPQYAPQAQEGYSQPQQTPPQPRESDPINEIVDGVLNSIFGGQW